MKILQVNNFHYLRGGSERYFFDVTRVLKERGHDVRTFATACQENENAVWMVEQVPLGISTDRVYSIEQLWRFIYSSEARSAIRRTIKHYKPDLVHLHIYYGQLTPSILHPIKEFGIPIVQTLHDYKLVCPTHGLRANGRFCDACRGKSYWNALIKRCNRNSISRSFLSMVEAYVAERLGVRAAVNRFIAVSNYQRNQLIRLGIPENSISVLYNFTYPAPQPASKPGSYILYVGRISEEKGIKILLDSYALLPDSSPPLKVVGTGPKLDTWYSYAQNLKLDKRVEWLGHKAGNDLSDLYRGCAFLVNPTQLNETFGLTCLESLAQGRAVVASRAGAIPEIVRDEVDGLIVNPGDVDDLAAAMQKLIDDQESAIEMGRRGWENVNRLYSPTRHYYDLMKIYREVLVNG